MRERDPPHSAAIAVGIAACANNKMLGHTAMLEANAQRTTRLRNPTVWQALDFEYFRERPYNLELGISKFRMRTSARFEHWFLAGNFLVSACSGHIVTESANAGLGDYKFVASEF